MSRAKESIRSLLPTRIRKHSILAGPLRGSRIVTSWHDYPGAILGTTERPLLEWFAREAEPGSTWIDIGAHYGYTAISLSRLVGASGRVFAFEPVLATAGCITHTRALNGLAQLTVVPLGLDNSPHLHAVRLPIVRGMADSTIGGGIWLEQILTTSLDSVWPSLCGANPEIRGMKIDVQGMEMQVLLGMRQILLRWQPRLVVEFHRGVDRSEILNFLSSCGYSTISHPIEPGSLSDSLADDTSHAFHSTSSECAFSSTPSSIVQS